MKVLATRFDVEACTLVTTLQPETRRDYEALGLPYPFDWITMTLGFIDDSWRDLQRWADDGGRV